ncbi:MAG: DUF2589 domain-containing protein [Desulfobacteraceae bacterium]|jgi:hypothetical protein|nr:DUF2589 domain-containing protein [Desulfobacteraceae bacterium]
MSINTAQSLYELVGAPLMALVDAESQAAKATANFIKEMGFKEASSTDEHASVEEFGRQVDFGDLRMVKFRSQRRQADGREREFQVEVPLLSLLPIPALQIKDAELEFYAKIVEFPKIGKPSVEPEPEEGKNQAGESTSPEDERARKYRLPSMPERELKATFGTTSGGDSVSRQQRMDMQIKIKIRMEQADIPAGLGSLFNLMQQNISTTET